MIKIKGVKFSGIYCGIKKNKKKDLALAYFEKPALASGVFTKNRVKAPSVIITKKRINNPIQALIVVSGNACVCAKGDYEDSRAITKTLARHLSVEEKSVAHSTTGVIGVKLPVEKVIDGIPQLIKELKDNYEDFAEAITTTDAYKKVEKITETVNGGEINILGIAKGAGMIAPDLATMLVYIFTDAKIEKKALDRALKEAVDCSFNSISVDGDTSTNDMVLIFSTGVANNKEITIRSGYKDFLEALKKICISLAKMIVRDGEGATKVIEINVKNAKSAKDAKKIAKTVANSPLVKTAFFGEDPNWGRIIAAIGRSGVSIKKEKIDIDIQGKPVVRNGIEANGFDERGLKEALAVEEIQVEINLHAGKASTKFYTSDLTLDYVKINSSYRT
ncbi:MAG: bifunctional glutamate N-acetyltransferase/amino-acid acetyltransferase ArgJ [Proteobacteria bacterium]|nr:bifunctional glutamate N-acetyltransferase/amino-acid acetyltransferase ArgJ [Pseudomonadota bacterium]